VRRRAQETRLYRLEMNERILSSGFKPFHRFFALDAAAYEPGAIPTKYKEMMGLVGSMVLRCNDCIFYHLDRCIQEGATREELHEAMNIALIIGGSIVIPHLRYAYEMLDELLSSDRSDLSEPSNPNPIEGGTAMATVHIKIATVARDQVRVPWLWRLGRDFDLQVNILKANIDEDFGWALLELQGSAEEIQRATAWLHTTGLHVEPVERSVSE
jgi:AhpD family alkylhydroperoxidase